MLYWTDRGDPPRGNTVNRASIDRNLKKKRKPPEILLTHLMEGIGIALDLKEERMFLTDLGGRSIQLSSMDQIRRHYFIRRGISPALHTLNYPQILHEHIPKQKQQSNRPQNEKRCMFLNKLTYHIAVIGLGLDSIP